MVSRVIIVITLFSLALLMGGCGGRNDESTAEPADESGLEEYSSTLLNTLSKAKKAKIQASLSAIRLQINRFKEEQGRYPDSVEELSLPPDVPPGVLDYSSATGEVSLKE